MIRSEIMFADSIGYSGAMLSRVKFVDGRFFHPLVPPSGSEWCCIFVRAKSFGVAGHFDGVVRPLLSPLPVVSWLMALAHFAVLKVSSDMVLIVSAKRDDCVWAITRAMRRKGLEHRNRLKPFRWYIAPRREQLTNLNRLLLVDYVFRRIFFHLLEV